ncbi:hypothetical protein CF336_g7895 [Tilletia laevis]|nr:hypothetical protein CF336_g7895 [Tilletia laevis]
MGEPNSSALAASAPRSGLNGAAFFFTRRTRSGNNHRDGSRSEFQRILFGNGKSCVESRVVSPSASVLAQFVSLFLLHYLRTFDLKLACAAFDVDQRAFSRAANIFNRAFFWVARKFLVVKSSIDPVESQQWLSQWYMVAKPWIDVGVWIVWIDWILHIHFRYLPRPIWRRLVNTWERWPGPLRCKSHAEAQKTLKRSLYAVVLASMASPCPFIRISSWASNILQSIELHSIEYDDDAPVCDSGDLHVFQVCDTLCYSVP